jgi:chaperonin GroES
MENEEIISGLAQGILNNPPQTEGEEQVVDGLAQAELTGRIRNAPSAVNLAEYLDEEQLRTLGKEVYQGYEEDDKSRADWVAMHTFWLSLYMQNDYAENSSQERDWGATESIPVLTEACDQFQARTYKVFFPNDTFVSAIPMRRTSKDREELEKRADRIGKHMSYQLGFQDRNYKADKKAMFLGVALHGSFFTKTYFDEKLRRQRTDNVRPTDLVVNYTVGPVRIEDLRRKTHILYSTVGTTEDLKNDGFFIEAARAGDDTTGNSEYNVKVDESMGLQRPEGTIKSDKLAILLEQHCFLDLDGSGQKLPYIVTICKASKKVLRVVIGYEADESGQPLDDYKQIQYFTHYKFKENPDGFYGLGLGHSIGELNSAINIILRQTVDAGTLANDGNMSGFVAESLGLEGDTIRMVLGKFIKIPDTMQDLSSAIKMMQFPGPNQTLIKLLEALDQRAQRLGSVTEATTGTMDKVVQPTTQLSMVEQSLEAFSSTQMSLANSFSEELQKIYAINKRFLPFIEYFVVNGEPETITRADYADDMLIEPIFDPKYATQSQKLARAQAELQITLQNPVNQTRPQVIDEACRRVLKAMDVEDIDALIPPQPQIENFDDQFMENMWFLMPKEARPLFDVFPEQNHAQHIAIMDQFLMQYGAMLQPDQKEDVLKHYQKHQGYLYGQLHGVIPAGQISTPPLAARQDGDVDYGPTTPEIPPEAAQLLSQIMGSAGGLQQPAASAGDIGAPIQ